jgi:phosphoribosylamine-glycine ligase
MRPTIVVAMCKSGRLDAMAEALHKSASKVGTEEPLAAGVVDELRKFGIPSVGPTQKLAQLETSKSFTRELLTSKCSGRAATREGKFNRKIQSFLGTPERPKVLHFASESTQITSMLRWLSISSRRRQNPICGISS